MGWLLLGLGLVRIVEGAPAALKTRMAVSALTAASHIAGDVPMLTEDNIRVP